MSKLFSNGFINNLMEYPYPVCNFTEVRLRNIASEYSLGGSYCTLHLPSVIAIDTYAECLLNSDIKTHAYGYDKEDDVFNCYYSEFITNNLCRYITIYQPQSGCVTTTIENINSTNDSSDFVPIFFSILGEALNDSEFNKNFYEYLEMKNSGFLNDIDEIKKVIGIMCDNLYRRIQYPQNCGNSGIKIELLQSTSLGSVNDNYGFPSNITFGTFELIHNSYQNHNVLSNSIKALRDKYSLNITYSNEETSLIPKFDDCYSSSDTLETTVKLINQSHNTRFPMKNILIFGQPGSGKTTLARQIAYVLNMPYLYFSCEPGTERSDLELTLLPNISKKELKSIPSMVDLKMDPSIALLKATDIYKPDITADEALSEMFKYLEQNNTDFISVPSSIVSALKYGYLVEIQEPLIIEREGMLAGINSASDDTQSITLLTGEIIKRHPNCIFVFTTNTDSAGCKEINNSVLSRCPIKIPYELPSLQTLIRRTINRTQCTDEEIVKKMAEAVISIQDKMNKDFITDGIVGSRELTAWVQTYMILGDVKAAAELTVIPSVSFDDENRDRIRKSIINMKF